MKKAVLASIIATAVAAPAMANVAVDVWSENDTYNTLSKQGVKVEFAPVENVGMGIELNTKGDVEIDAGYKWELNENSLPKASG